MNERLDDQGHGDKPRESDTPRTDALLKEIGWPMSARAWDSNVVYFTRELERELAAAERRYSELELTSSAAISALVAHAEKAGRPTSPSAGGLIPQGPCETTQTPRFQIADCACGTYKGNLGPCLTWWQGNSGRCVYCEHGLDCHVKLSKLLTPSEKRQDDPKNANLAALVLKLDKHISLHEMFAPEWEAVVAAARATPQSARTLTMSYDDREDIIFKLQRVRITDWSKGLDGTPEEIREVTAADMLDCVLDALGIKVNYVSSNPADSRANRG